MTNLEQYITQISRETESKTLLPSAQLILLYHIYVLAKGAVGKMTSFKELALTLDYSAMAITKAAEDLQRHKFLLSRFGSFAKKQNPQLLLRVSCCPTWIRTKTY